MEPLMIDVHLCAPLALRHPWIHLDGLVAHLWLNRQMGREFYNLPNRVVDIELDLPLKRHPSGLWHASASVLIPQHAARRVWKTTIYKRFHEGRQHGPRSMRRVTRGSGHYKDYMIAMLTFPITTVRFYAVGDREALVDILSDLVTIGFKGAIGWGAVARIEVRPCARDHSIVSGNIAMRPIPTRLLAWWDDEAVLTWTVPYWDRRRAEPCAPPGAQVRWKGEM